MNWRVVRSTDRGYVTASDNFEDFKLCIAEVRQLSASSDDLFAIQELPSGSIVWNEE